MYCNVTLVQFQAPTGSWRKYPLSLGGFMMAGLMRVFPILFLYLNAAVYAWVAWLFLFDPQKWFEVVGVVLSNAVGWTELRAVYGGFFAGIAMFLLLCGWRRAWVEPGIALLTLTYVGLVAARSWGILVDNAYNDLILQIYIVEWCSLLLSLLALFCLRLRR
jgi:hypothetical protein